MITKEKLGQIYIHASADVIDKYLEGLNDAFVKFDISTILRRAAFLAQIGHESGELRYTKEIWGPTPAQSKYEGRLDLGNTERGDGKRFLGRGLIQITGRANYTICGKSLDLDLLDEPELLEQPRYASLSAAWYWKWRGCNVPADMGDMERVTKLINGGLNGYEQRMEIYGRALSALSAS